MDKLKKVISENKVVVFLGAGLGLVAIGGAYLFISQEESEKEYKIDPTVKAVPLAERLGGEYGVAAVIEGFFNKLTSDKTLKVFFQGKNEKDIKKKMVNYAQVLFGDKNSQYNNKSLEKAHQNLKITNENFDQALFLYVKSFGDLGLDKREIDDAKEAFNSLRQKIVTSQQ